MFLSLRSLLSCFQHSITNHSLYLRTKQIILSRSVTFSAFFFVLRNMFLSLRSLLSCFQHSITNHCPYFRTKQILLSRSITFSAFCFFVRNMFLSLRSLLSWFQHSRTNHFPYLRTKKSIFSRSITFSAFFFCQKLVFKFEISSFLLLALKNKSLPIFKNKQIILSRSITFSAFFVVRNLFLILRFLLSCFQHSRTNHCPYLRTSKSYFLEASHFVLFLLSNFFFIVMVLEKITQTCFVFSSRSLLSCFRHSRTNHCPYLRTSKSYFLEVSHFLLFFFFYSETCI